MRKEDEKIKIPTLTEALNPIAKAGDSTVKSEHAYADLQANQQTINNSSARLDSRPEILSITKLGNTWFGVDIEKRQFIKIGFPEHTISFDHMIYKGDHYEMKFDLFTEKPPLEGSLNNEDVVTLKIPPLVQIALKEMSEKYAIPDHELLKLSDFEVMVNLKALGEREKGVLPTYEISDTKYEVDLETYCFRFGSNRIALNAFTPVSEPNGDRYAYMDTNTHRLVKIDIMSIKEMPPENIVKVVIPSNDKLDPYHVGKNREPDLKTFLLANPMVPGQKANIIPLSQTNIPAIIKSNVKCELRWQFEQTQRYNARKMRNGIK